MRLRQLLLLRPYQSRPPPTISHEMWPLQGGLVLQPRMPAGELEEPQTHLPQRRGTTTYRGRFCTAERLNTIG